MQVRQFLGSCWRGEGVVRTAFGRVLRRFRVTYQSAWYDTHQAFHVDEQVSYEDGRSLQRKWAITLDERGAWSGTDDAGGRMTFRAGRDALFIDFDRSKVVDGFSARSLRLKLQPAGDGALKGAGVTRFLGVPLARTTLVFTRTPASR